MSGLLRRLWRVSNRGFVPMAGGMKMVVGLGNPGDEYVDTRHNIGFRVIDSLAEALKIDVRRRKFGARFGLGEFTDKKLILLKPWQYMNRSGQAVATAVGFYKLGLSNLLVVTDDLALSPGRLRIRATGSAGGHNGLADVIEKLGTDGFARLRIGIGPAPIVRHPRGRDRTDLQAAAGVQLVRGRKPAVDFVLDKPTGPEKILLDEAIERSREAVFCWVEHGIESAMNKFNSG